jgi:lipoate-protein ligase A
MGVTTEREPDRDTATVEMELEHDLELLGQAAHQGRSTFRTWISHRHTVVVGRAVDVDSEVDIAHCARLEVPIVRRPSGGRSVVIGPGTVQYTFALPYGLSAELAGISSSKRFCNRLLLEALADPRIAEDDSGDLLVDDRKVGGLAIKRGREAMLLHGTLLVAADIDALASLLRHPLREPAYRRGRAHAEFLANLGALDRDSLERRVTASLAGLV